ncbi:hypothetical protein PHYC_03453 [Phycisphaerales bacterium]|nr:hypothetical protein PHYC_03453 [Phycisphaerales bacterium]
MIERFAQFPKALADRTRRATLAGVPALIAHPDWKSRAPVMLWMHGRTVSKELDPGRYLRWIRAGIAAVALDLPGHGERFDAELQKPERVLDIVARMLPEIDLVVDALADPAWHDILDFDRMGLGGMSAGGMAALRRLCEGHDFACAAVECTTGWLEGLFLPGEAGGGRPPWNLSGDLQRLKDLDPMSHLPGWNPLPVLLLSTQTDRLVPFATVTRFVDRLREHYAAKGADPSLAELQSWRDTGAPEEHAGFGRFGNDAKNAQVEFLRAHLVRRPTDPA